MTERDTMRRNSAADDYNAYCKQFEGDPRIIAARKRYRADKRACVVESTADQRLYKAAREVREELKARGQGFPE